MEQDAAAQQGYVPAVTLRRFELADVDAMMEWASDPEVAAFMTWDAYTSREALLTFLRDAVLLHPRPHRLPRRRRTRTPPGRLWARCP